MSVFKIISASAHLALAALFLLTWARPAAIDRRMASRLLIAMVMEFFVLFPTAALTGKGAVSVGGLGATAGSTLTAFLVAAIFCGAFIALISHSLKSWWPAAAFAALLTSRLAFALGIRSPREMEIYVGGAAILYIVLAALTTATPFPPWGMTPEARQESSLPGRGPWVEHPERLMAFGTLYFAAAGLLGIFAAG